MYALRAFQRHLSLVLGHTCLLSIRLDYLVSPSAQLRTRVCMADFEKVIQLTHDRVTSLDAILSVLRDCERAWRSRDSARCQARRCQARSPFEPISEPASGSAEHWSVLGLAGTRAHVQDRPIGVVDSGS